MPPVAVILAGGRARRMGGADKALLQLGGRPLLRHVLDRIAPQVGAVALSANGDPARFAAFGLPVLPDPLPDTPGPLAGILAGLRWAAATHPDARHLLSVPTDTPFLPADLVARLRGAAAPIACAASAGQRHPAVALWPVALARDLADALAAGVRGVGLFALRHGVAEIDFPAADRDPFTNINDPDALAEMQRRLG
jgi:molybdopterin-guanine dinucleotide biosynthesis protein A